MKIYKSEDGRRFEVLCRCVNGHTLPAYRREMGGFAGSYITGGKYDNQCPKCACYYYYDPEEPLPVTPTMRWIDTLTLQQRHTLRENLLNFQTWKRRTKPLMIRPDAPVSTAYKKSVGTITIKRDFVIFSVRGERHREWVDIFKATETVINW